jgi:hypothetical protein
MVSIFSRRANTELILVRWLTLSFALFRYNNDETGCEDFGSILPTANGLTADVACCTCGGGVRSIEATRD